MRTTLILLLLFVSSNIHPFSNSSRWITSSMCQNTENTWIGFRKDFQADSIPASVVASIAADSKYWLWINDSLVVFEGGLKRGPSPQDTYYDEVQIAPFLKKGNNKIEVKLWFFGKDGFSHNSSGKAGLFFDCETSFFNLQSDKTWNAQLLPAFQTCAKPLPNFRLSESSILYDGRLHSINSWQIAMEMGQPGDSPWNKLVKRPIPLFRFSGLLTYKAVTISTKHQEHDSIFCTLPYNCQITPQLKIETEKSGQRIVVCTDNYLKYNGGANILRAEYITEKGIQQFECFGWMNGHQVVYILPKGIKVLELNYRESGYDADMVGQFECSDPFFNKLVTKSARTLYLTMRDQFMDCPDRERAQWTGDAVLESAQCFYVMSSTGNQLTKKWLDEFYGWQKADGTLFSPSPAGNWKSELPDQSLTTVGHYGLWNYVLYSGNRENLIDHYERTQRYLDLWKSDKNDLMEVRQGDWNWGDWGENKDMKLLYNLWYFLAVKGMSNIAKELGYSADVSKMNQWMTQFEQTFNNLYWNGSAYRSAEYKGETDDRVQALAVVSGIASKEKYPSLLKVFNVEEHASPYMEKYVFEAMVQMGYVDEAMQRHKKRFSYMVEHPSFTTLFEGWGIGRNGFGGGTVNHAWSGGGLTVLMSQIAGIKPASVGFGSVLIEPAPGSLKWINCTVPHPVGLIQCSFKFQGKRVQAIIQMPGNLTGTFKWNGKSIKLTKGQQTIKL